MGQLFLYLTSVNDQGSAPTATHLSVLPVTANIATANGFPVWLPPRMGIPVVFLPCTAHQFFAGARSPPIPRSGLWDDTFEGDLAIPALFPYLPPFGSYIPVVMQWESDIHFVLYDEVGDEYLRLRRRCLCDYTHFPVLFYTDNAKAFPAWCDPTSCLQEGANHHVMCMVCRAHELRQQALGVGADNPAQTGSFN